MIDPSRRVRHRIAMLAGLCAATSLSPWASAQLPGVEHVLLIGVDGLSPAGIEAAPTPVMDSLIRRGAHTFAARAVFPTSSSSNWASMVNGGGTEQHGITSNDWQRADRAIKPADTGMEPLFPTIFGQFRTQRPSAVINVIYHWSDFGRLYERSAATLDLHTPTQQAATNAAIDSFKQAKPTLTFVHLDHVDGAGHRHGWSTPPYLAAVQEADTLIGQMIDGLRDAGLLDTTLIIITSDHGGINKGHGGETMDELEIPWIIAGPGIAEGREITRAVKTTDTAATVAHALGFTLSDAAIGRPVVEALASTPEGPRVGTRRPYLPAPAIIPPTLRTTEPKLRVTLMNEDELKAALGGRRGSGESPGAAPANPAPKLRYTLDGTDPTEASSTNFPTSPRSKPTAPAPSATSTSATSRSTPTNTRSASKAPSPSTRRASTRSSSAPTTAAASPSTANKSSTTTASTAPSPAAAKPPSKPATSPSPSTTSTAAAPPNSASCTPAQASKSSTSQSKNSRP